MIVCNTCGTRISDLATRCPKCGNDPRGPANTQWARQQERRVPPGQSNPMRAQVRRVEAPQPTRRSGQVVSTCRKHWAAYLFPGLIAALFTFGIFNTLVQGEFGNTLFDIFMVALIVLFVYASYNFNYIEMTEDRIIAHKGIIKSSITSMPIDRIQHISIQSDLSGKLFGYDTITIVNAGSGSFSMHYMAEAQTFADLINTRIDKGQRVFF